MCAVFLVVTIEMMFSSINGASLGGCHGVHDLNKSEYQQFDKAQENEMDEGLGGRVVGGGEGSTKSEREELNSLIEITTMGRGSKHRRSGSIAESLILLER